MNKVELLISENWKNIINLDKSLMTSRVQKIAIDQNDVAMRYVNAADQDYKLCFKMVAKNPKALKYVKNAVKDEKMCMMALKKDISVARFVGCTNFTPKICDYIMDIDPGFFYKIPDGSKTKELCLKAVKLNGLDLSEVPFRLMGDKDIMLEAVKQDGMALKHCRLRDQTFEIALEAIRQDINALDHAKFDYICRIVKIGLENI